MKVADPRLLHVEIVGETVELCICEPGEKFPAVAVLTGMEAQSLAGRILHASGLVNRAECEKMDREEEEILRRAERIWRSRNPGKPFLAAVS